ncbi:MAG: dipeptide/oligopeptide/nickel transporter ATP-binding protein [Oscillospiraceae bacterium]|nr:dipeptide/oligopeptide/nickel transporter ATP-binding protein [Oscillospiraceae bacterium]
MEILNIKDLKISFNTDTGVVEAVNGISLSVGEGESLGLVGETGAGKTTTALGILRLIQCPPGEFVKGEIFYKGQDILKMKDQELRDMRGAEISMIFQDPMSALNPVMTIGEQISEVILHHQKCTKEEAERQMLAMLEQVRIPAERAGEYPYQFSGGMKQRVIIAIALACHPKLLIADEPTTALDVTIQAQVLEMINALKRTNHTSMLLITHDLGVVAESCEKVAIMYAGEIVESGSVADIFDATAHPYTKGLFNSIPSISKKMDRLKPIEGMMPDPGNLPTGCKFHPRCPFASDLETCAAEEPIAYEVTPGHFVRCHRCRSWVEELKVERGVGV